MKQEVQKKTHVAAASFWTVGETKLVPQAFEICLVRFFWLSFLTLSATDGNCSDAREIISIAETRIFPLSIWDLLTVTIHHHL